MRVTEFGKQLRKLRIDLEVNLKSMAERLGITSAYLSAIELGKKNVNYELVDQIGATYSLTQQQKTALREAADQSQISLKMDLSTFDFMDRGLVASFAREFEHMTPEKKQQLERLLSSD